MNESADGVIEGCEDTESFLDKTSIRMTIIVIYIAVFFICLIGNMFAIIVICLHKSMRTSTNFFLGNLAFADLLVAIFCIIQNMFHIFSINGQWMFGEILCKLYVFILHLAPCVVVGVLVCVSLEKYVAVLHPLLSMKLLTPQLRITLMAGIWAISLFVNLPYYFTSKEKRWGQITACSRDSDGPISIKSMVTMSFFSWYCIPLIIMGFLYSRIGMVLWKSSLKPLEVRYSNDSNGTTIIHFEPEALSENGNHHLNLTTNRNPSEDSPNTQTNNLQNGAVTSELIESRKKIIRLLIVIVLSFAVLTLPHHLRLLYNEWSTSHRCIDGFEVMVQPVSYLLLFISTGLNPIVYAFMSKRFRSATRDLLNCKAGTRKFTRTRTICSEVQENGSRSPSLHTRTALQQSRS